MLHTLSAGLGNLVHKVLFLTSNKLLEKTGIRDETAEYGDLGTWHSYCS